MLFFRTVGWKKKNYWRTLCSGGCSFPWDVTKTAKVWYKSDGKTKSFTRTFRIIQSYKCLDGYNNYVAQPYVNGVSVGIIPSSTTTITATLNFKYTAVVAAGDVCRIQYCRSYVDGVIGGTETCVQGHGGVNYVGLKRSVGKGIHSYKVDIGSYRLQAEI